MQSRGMSALEAVCNVIVGWLAAFLTQLVLFPVVGMQMSLSQNLLISSVFTTVSLVRSYALRRLFISWDRANTRKDKGVGRAVDGTLHSRIFSEREVP